MDPAQLAHEACRRFEALHTSGSHTSGSHTSGSDRGPIEPAPAREPDPAADRGGRQSFDPPADAGPLLEVFDHLGKLDGWAKIAMDRLAGDPRDNRAAEELCGSLEHTARLHPYFARRLAAVLAQRPVVGVGTD